MMQTVLKDYTLRFEHAGWEYRFQKETEENKAILITDKECLDQRTMEATANGLFAKEFGVAIDTDAEIKEYTCDCGARTGRFDEGEICDECDTPVKLQFGISLTRVGWIDIAPYFIIVPGMYQKLETFIGPKKLRDMLHFECEIDVDGHHVVKEMDSRKPFHNIGLVEFQRNFDEIMSYFARTSKNAYLYEFIMENKNRIFSSKIPVLTPLLRPAYTSARNRQFNYHDMNANYTQVLTDYDLIKTGKRSGLKAVELMSKIQSYCLNIYESISTRINGKKRLIREETLSKRVTYSSRHVIISKVGKNGKLDAVDISYKGFLGLFKLEIINCMRRGYGDPSFRDMTYYELLDYIQRCEYSNTVDPIIYNIMNQLKDRMEGLYLLINRNPTFDLGSIQCMKIDQILENAQDKVLAVPISSLSGWNGDFDGDVLNIFSMKEKCVIEAFKKAFDPKRLILDRTGSNFFNPAMGMIKDRLTNLNIFLDDKYDPIDPDDVELTLRDSKELELEEFLKDHKKFRHIQKLIKAGKLRTKGFGLSIYDIDDNKGNDSEVPGRVQTEEGDYWFDNHAFAPKEYRDDALVCKEK